MQRRLLIDKAHTALDIFRFAHMVLIYMCRSILVDLCRACFHSKKAFFKKIHLVKILLFGYIFTSLSIVAKLSSLSSGWVDLRLSWVEAELELKLSWDWALQVFQLFNWSNWSLQLKCLKSCSILLLSRLGGWVVGFFCYLKIRLFQPQSWSWS